MEGICVAGTQYKERLGHKDIKITLNTYGYLYPSQQKEVADMLGISQSYISRLEKKIIDHLRSEIEGKI